MKTNPVKIEEKISSKDIALENFETTPKRKHRFEFHVIQKTKVRFGNIWKQKDKCDAITITNKK